MNPGYVIIEKKDVYDTVGHTLIRTHAESGKAELARLLLEKLSIATGEPDGVDEAGRQKWKLISPHDVVQRACDIADRAFDEFDRRGWMIVIPPVTNE